MNRYQVIIPCLAAALLVVPHFSNANAQGIGGVLSGAQTQVQQRVQQQVQAQVQQRVQAQVQSQVQAQVQSQVQQRIQAQIAGGIQARVNNSIEATAQQAANLAARLEARGNAIGSAATNVASDTRVSANAGLNSNVRAREANSGRGGISASSSFQGGVNSSLPMQISHADIAVYDQIFGQFNPLRTAAVNNNGNATGNIAGSSSVQAASRSAIKAESDSQFGVAGVLGSSIDLSSMIQVAARQRRAEISQMRDHAIENANAEMMTQADAMESQLNAFAAAQQRATVAGQRNVRAAGSAAATVSSTSNVDVQLRSRAAVRTDGQRAATANGRSKTNATVR